FFELRSLFEAASQYVQNILQGQPQNFPLPGGAQLTDVLTDTNDRPLIIEFRNASLLDANSNDRPITGFVATASRTDGPVGFEYLSGKNRCGPDQPSGGGVSGALLRYRNARYDLSPLQTACQVIGKAMYVGAFRNAVNFTPHEAYFDISVGSQVFAEWR